MGDSMFRVTETITIQNEIVKQTEMEFQTKLKMEEWITSQKVNFNSKRFLATINGQGIEFSQRKQVFTIIEI